MTEPSDAEPLTGGASADFGRLYDRYVGVVVAFVGARTRQPEAIFRVLPARMVAGWLRTDLRARTGCQHQPGLVT